MAATSIPQFVAKMQIGGADKKALTQLLQAQADDIATLTAAVNTLMGKMDTVGGTIGAVGTTNLATSGITAAKLNLRK